MIDDTRNVIDIYRGWSVDDIKASLDKTRMPLEIAVENLQRDFNMGTIVRTANAFNVSKIHVVGRRQWNKRGAMVTDRYMNIEYHATVQDFCSAVAGKSIIAVDNVPGATSLFKVIFPKNSVLVFGSEGDGLSREMQDAAEGTVMIPQFGSTRSINVGVAAGIVMYEWVRQHYPSLPEGDK